MKTNSDLRAKLEEVNGEIESKRSTASDKWSAFEQARDQFASAGNDATRTDSEEFQKAEQVHKEYAAVASDVKDLEAVRDGIFAMLGEESPVEKNGDGPSRDREARGREQLRPLGQRILESEGYKELVASGALDTDRAKFNARLSTVSRDEVKAWIDGRSPQAALLTGASDTSGGAFVANDVKPFVPQPTRQLKILDLITVGDTDSDTVEYVRQDAFTNTAAETAEATSATTGTKPEATIAFTKVTEAVKNIAHWVPATRRSLRDAGQLRTIVEGLLRYGLNLRMENQVVSGDGTGENIRGIVNTSGVLTQAKGTDSVADAIHKAITQVRLGYVDPNGIGLHPNDWEVVRLSKDGQGQYLLGPPGMAGAEQLWGLPVAVTAAVPDDTGLVGDWRYATLWLREAAQILASDSHDDFFVKNLVVILAEIPAAFGVQLPAAFCKVTGLD